MDGAGSAEAAVLRTRPEAPALERVAAPGLAPLGLGRGRDGLIFTPARPGPDAALPLVVAFHGAGGTAAQMVDMLRPEAERCGVALLAPDSRAQTWDVIRGGYGPDVAFIDRALRFVFERLPVDSGRIAVAGFSDGASYALSLGLANGTLFGDVLAFSPGFMAPPSQAGSPRIFISHGDRDEVLPIASCSRRLAPALRQAGYDLDYREFAGGHAVPPEMIALGLARFLA